MPCYGLLTVQHSDPLQAAMTASQALRTLLGTCNAHKAMLLLQLLLPRERDAHRRAQAAVQGQGQAAAEGQAVRGERLVAVMDGARQLAGRCAPRPWGLPQDPVSLWSRLIAEADELGASEQRQR